MSSAAIKDWRSYPEGREKYQLYLASREWAVLKEAVRKRSGGTCERCQNAPGANVHHQTYVRKYREQLEDLVHVCIPCHEFVSGKRNDDPALLGPVRLMGREIESVYLAGKITGTRWRDEIVKRGWSFQKHSAIDFEIEDMEWQTVVGCLPLPDGRKLNLTGPYWRSAEISGHGDIMASERPHAATVVYDDHRGETRGLPDTFGLLLEIARSILNADLMFAWIDSHDCHGTLAEIGYACRDRLVVVASPPNFDISELWIAFNMADAIVSAASPGEAWRKLWKGQFTRRPDYDPD